MADRQGGQGAASVGGHDNGRGGVGNADNVDNSGAGAGVDRHSNLNDTADTVILPADDADYESLTDEDEPIPLRRLDSGSCPVCGFPVLLQPAADDRAVPQSPSMCSAFACRNVSDDDDTQVVPTTAPTTASTSGTASTPDSPQSPSEILKPYTSPHKVPNQFSWATQDSRHHVRCRICPAHPRVYCEYEHLRRHQEMPGHQAHVKK